MSSALGASAVADPAFLCVLRVSAFDRFFRFVGCYLPMQKVEKIWLRMSSAVTSPVMAPSGRRAL